MKLFPILGGLILLGVLVQIVLGFAVERGTAGLSGIHASIGIAGLALVLLATALAWMRRTTAPLPNILLMAIVLVVVVVQVGLGLSMLFGSATDILIASHEGTAFLILALVIVEAFLTMRRVPGAKATSPG